MKRLCLLTSFTLLCLSSAATLFAGGVRTSIQIDVGDDDPYVQDEVIWIGPGWYYGVWFSNEADFYYWRRDRGYWHHYDNNWHGHGGHGGHGHGGGHGH
jgi:hypothetical protein